LTEKAGLVREEWPGQTPAETDELLVMEDEVWWQVEMAV
jgi:hypothetical protein